MLDVMEQKCNRKRRFEWLVQELCGLHTGSGVWSSVQSKADA